MKPWTEDQFIARCKTVYRTGLAQPGHFILMQRWLDALMRYEHTMFSHGQSQGLDWMDFLEMERERLSKAPGTLASDHDGYALQQIVAVFAHHCQICAESTEAWHTRPGFCSHKRGEK